MTSIRLAATIAAARFDVRVEDVFGSRRIASHVKARRVAWFIMRYNLGMSLPMIGRHFEGERENTTKDHTTVLRGLVMVERDADMMDVALECSQAFIEQRQRQQKEAA